MTGSGLPVPAGAEIVLEGRVSVTQTLEEGPFGEFTGYGTGKTHSPVFEVEAITHRTDPIFQDVVSGHMEHLVLSMPALEHRTLRDAKAACEEVTAVSLPAPLTSVIAIRKSSDEQPRRVIEALLSGDIYAKQVIVVDDDVDPNDLREVLAAAALQAQPDRDVIVQRDVQCTPLDPSCPVRGRHRLEDRHRRDPQAVGSRRDPQSDPGRRLRRGRRRRVQASSKVGSGRSAGTGGRSGSLAAVWRLAYVLAAAPVAAPPSIEASAYPSAEVSWYGPRTCPQSPSFESRLGQALVDSGRRLDPAVEVRVSESAGGFTASVVVDDGPPQTLESPDCGVIERATVQVVLASVAEIGPPRAIVDGQRQEQTEPAPAEKTEPAPAEKTEPTPERKSERGEETATAVGGAAAAHEPVSIELVAAAGARVDALPRAALAVHAGVGWRRWRVLIGGTHGVRRRGAATDAGVSAVTRSFGAEALACFVPVRGRWSFPLCGGAAVRSLWVEGDGPSVTARARRRAWTVALVGGAIRARISPHIELQGRGQAQVSLGTPRFHVQSGGREVPVFVLSPVAALVDAGLVVHWAIGGRR